MESKGRVFLDTNIILDIMMSERENHKKAPLLLAKLVDYDIFMSEDMLSTIYYITKEKEKTKHFFKTIQSEWNIVPFGQKVIQDAIDFSIQNSCDLEDTLQCFCAKANNCILLTNDKKFIDCGTKILTYNDFLGE